jgi:hypothetical protein
MGRISASRRITAALACVVLATASSGCGIRQAIYVPIGWNRTSEEAYQLRKGDVTASMPIMVVNKSDQTLHPAVTLQSKGHELRYAAASWTLTGKSVAPYSDLAPGSLIDSYAPMNLHWSTKGLGKMVTLLGSGSNLRIDVTVDGRPESIDIQLVRRDRH